MTNEKTKPIQSFRAGVIQTSIWKNTSKKGEFLSITYQRSYKNPENEKEWKQTTTLRVNDIPVLQMLLKQSFEWAKTKGAEELKNKEE